MPAYFQENRISTIFTGKLDNFILNQNTIWLENTDFFKQNDHKKHIHQHIFNELFERNSFESYIVSDEKSAKEMIVSATNFKLKRGIHVDVAKRISNIEFLIFNNKEFFLIINFHNFGQDYIKKVSDYWNLFFSIREYFKFTNVVKLLETILNIKETKFTLNESYGDNLEHARFKIFSWIELSKKNPSMYSDVQRNYILSCATNGNTFKNINKYKLESISLYKNNHLVVSQEGMCSLTEIRKNINFYKNGKHTKIQKDLKMAYYIYILQRCFLHHFKEDIMRYCDKNKVDLSITNNLLEELIYFTTNYRYTNISSFEYLNNAYSFILKQNNFDELMKDVEESVEPLFIYHDKKKNSNIATLIQSVGLIATVYTSYNVYKIIAEYFFGCWEKCNSLLCNDVFVLLIFSAIYLSMITYFRLRKTSKFNFQKKILQLKKKRV